MRSRGGLTDSSSPMDAMDAMDASRLCLRNDSCTAALSETITLSRGTRGKRTGTTQASTHASHYPSPRQGAAEGRCRVTHGQHTRTRTH